MKNVQSIQCQACGASSVVEHAEKSMLQCAYCGAMTAYKSNHSDAVGGYSKTKLRWLLMLIPVLVIMLMWLFWLVFQQTRHNSSIESFSKEISTAAESGETAAIAPQNIVTLNPQDTAPTATAQSDIPVNFNQFISIESQVSGLTNNGGTYWILTVKNNSDEKVARPGVMLSLFDSAGQRIEEQGGWSLREVLPAGEQTMVLVYWDQQLPEAVKAELTPFASKPVKYGLKQVEVEVKNFTVKAKNKRYEIIGDVVNNHDEPVKYVRLLVIAYDAEKQAVGIGNAFSTLKNLAPEQRSGFKVTVGTFLAAAPDSWQVWAYGKE